MFRVEDRTPLMVIDGMNQAGCTGAVLSDFMCLMCSIVGREWGQRHFSGTHGIEHRKQLGDERSAIRNSCLSTALDISFV